LVTVFE